MSEISFDENKYKIKSRVIFGQAEVPKMILFLTNKGLVKNENQAKMVLLGLTGCFFVASIVVFMVFVLDVRIGGQSNAITEEQLQENRDRFQQIINNGNNANTQTNQ
jgi:hypothetical protein